MRKFLEHVTKKRLRYERICKSPRICLNVRKCFSKLFFKYIKFVSGYLTWFSNVTQFCYRNIRKLFPTLERNSCSISERFCTCMHNNIFWMLGNIFKEVHTWDKFVPWKIGAQTGRRCFKLGDTLMPSDPRKVINYAWLGDANNRKK